MAKVVKIPAPDWKDRLLLKENGEVRSCLANVALILENDPAIAGSFAFDDFAYRTAILKPTPWSQSTNREWTDIDDINATIWLQQAHGLMVSRDIAGLAVQAVSDKRKTNPVLDYLQSLVWNGESRLDTAASRYLGASATAYNREVLKRWMISAVGRVIDPGCQADACLIMMGPQGVGKSSFVKILAKPWSADQISDLGGKDSRGDLQGVWIVELPELDSFGAVSQARIKAFITNRTDRFRPPYGKRTIELPRRCVFVGTVNPESTGFFKDPTGARRFWPIKVGNMDLAALEADRDQLWAEAVKLYRDGYRTYFHKEMDRALIVAQVDATDQHTEMDPWHEAVEEYLGPRKCTTMTALFREVLQIDDLTKRDHKLERRMGRILTKLQWERTQVRLLMTAEGKWISAAGDEIDVLDFPEPGSPGDQVRRWVYAAPANWLNRDN